MTNVRGNVFLTTHGKTGTKTYNIWKAMNRRCVDSNQENYQRYGALGITVCDRWKFSFENFLKDMGECPASMSIDRIDSFGNYCPENCRWATDEQQRRNKTNNKYIIICGQRMIIKDACRKFSLNQSTISSRVKKNNESHAQAFYNVLEAKTLGPWNDGRFKRLS